jgi:hypothetical protein
MNSSSYLRCSPADGNITHCRRTGNKWINSYAGRPRRVPPAGEQRRYELEFMRPPQHCTGEQEHLWLPKQKTRRRRQGRRAFPEPVARQGHRSTRTGIGLETPGRSFLGTLGVSREDPSTCELLDPEDNQCQRDHQDRRTRLGNRRRLAKHESRRNQARQVYHFFKRS